MHCWKESAHSVCPFVFWDGNDPVMQLRDSDGSGMTKPLRVADRFLYADIVDLILADQQFASGVGPIVAPSGPSGATNGQLYWPIADHLGSVRDVVDSGGIKREHTVYDEFGSIVSETDYATNGQPISPNTVGGWLRRGQTRKDGCAGVKLGIRDSTMRSIVFLKAGHATF